MPTGIYLVLIPLDYKESVSEIWSRACRVVVLCTLDQVSDTDKTQTRGIKTRIALTNTGNKRLTATSLPFQIKIKKTLDFPKTP